MSFSDQLYGAWRACGLDAAPRSDGSLTFCCPQCTQHPSRLILAEDTVTCPNCLWNACGPAWEIAQSAALVPKEPAAQPLFADLVGLLQGDLVPENPSVAPVLAPRCLFYAGRLNEIHGEPAVGKTNIMLASAISVIAAGGHVVYLDPEDNARGILMRLLGLGCNPDLIPLFHYVQNPEPDHYTQAQAWTVANKPTLVVLDGLAEALAAESLDENKPSDILGFFRARVRPFADAGAAVVIADHVVKNSETRGRWARGSGAKLGRYDGVAYEAALIEPYARGKAGAVKLKVAKDRNGGVGPCGLVTAELHLLPEIDCTRLEWRLPPTPEEWMPTDYMVSICGLLAANPAATARDVRALGKSDYVTMALNKLVQLGCISVQSNGRGRPTVYVLHRPFSA